ncbi:MAG: cell division protein FtsL [Polaromonas sp.]|jgi:cell division protein FtsL
MTRINLLMLVAVLLTALYLVHTQYESRRIFVELEKATSAGRKLEIDNETLQAEKRSQATPLRVDRLAKDKLQMLPATAAITHYATDRQPATAVAVKP